MHFLINQINVILHFTNIGMYVKAMVARGMPLHKSSTAGSARPSSRAMQRAGNIKLIVDFFHGAASIFN